MKILTLFFLALALSGCGTAPVDGTPPWDLAGRFGLPMFVDCNTARNNIGISGCAFKAGKLGGNLTLPSLWSGNIEFTSYYCKNVAVPSNQTNDNVFQVKDLYNNVSGDSCSFEIKRTVKHKNMASDNQLLGRFFIKIIKDDPFYSFLNFSVDTNRFKGVGWYQSKGQQVTLKIEPSSSQGTLFIACDKKEILKYQWNTPTFEIKVPEKLACDFELNAVNFETGLKEQATFIHSVPNQPTINLTAPQVTKNNKTVTFTFTDRDSSNKKPVVFGVIVDRTQCPGKAKCSVANNKDTYTVQGYTYSLRPFFGIYTLSTKSWEVF